MNTRIIKNSISNTVIAATFVVNVVAGSAVAESLNSESVYMSTQTSLYELNFETESADLVAETHLYSDQIEGIAFDGEELYAAGSLQQLYKYEDDTMTMSSINSPTSYA